MIIVCDFGLAKEEKYNRLIWKKFIYVFTIYYAVQVSALLRPWRDRLQLY